MNADSTDYSDLLVFRASQFLPAFVDANLLIFLKNMNWVHPVQLWAFLGDRDPASRLLTGSVKAEVLEASSRHVKVKAPESVPTLESGPHSAATTLLLMKGQCPAMFHPSLHNKRLKQGGIIQDEKLKVSPKGLGVTGIYARHVKDLKLTKEEQYI
ncbi:hypothetical protein B0H14DRAFT_2574037 [Mycena olivaceomarginata]|nr:hypothetical protein B0H14DRAFT_2574037 [Mycena olivaceomarginata]